MDSRISPPLACRYCHHYQFEGRRGGHCQQLGVLVKGQWSSCSLMTPSLSASTASKPCDIQLEQYVSEIYSYETAARLKTQLISSQVRTSAKAS